MLTGWLSLAGPLHSRKELRHFSLPVLRRLSQLLAQLCDLRGGSTCCTLTPDNLLPLLTTPSTTSIKAPRDWPLPVYLAPESLKKDKNVDLGLSKPARQLGGIWVALRWEKQKPSFFCLSISQASPRSLR